MTASCKQTLIYVAFTICSSCVTSILLLEEWLVLPAHSLPLWEVICVLLAGSADCKLFILSLISVCAIDLLRQSPDSWWHKLPVQCFGHSLVWCMHSLGAAGLWQTRRCEQRSASVSFSGKLQRFAFQHSRRLWFALTCNISEMHSEDVECSLCRI